MKQYAVTYADAAPSQLAALSFQASGLNEALAFVADHHAEQPVELWCEGKFLGRLELVSGDEGSVWRLG